MVCTLSSVSSLAELMRTIEHDRRPFLQVDCPSLSSNVACHGLHGPGSRVLSLLFGATCSTSLISRSSHTHSDAAVTFGSRAFCLGDRLAAGDGEHLCGDVAGLTSAGCPAR